MRFLRFVGFRLDAPRALDRGLELGAVIRATQRQRVGGVWYVFFRVVGGGLS